MAANVLPQEPLGSFGGNSGFNKTTLSPGELELLSMNRAQRIVLILYCLLVVYCCVWVPWHLVQSPATDGFHEWRTGYGLIWNGPSKFADSPSGPSIYSTPNLPIIGLRLLAVTAIAGAGFVAATFK
jgi:hypothetical protein